MANQFIHRLTTVAALTFALACGPDSDPVDSGLPDAGECSSSSDCDDGVFCNGNEQCEAGSCVPGDRPCPASAGCEESSEACLDGCPDADGDGFASATCGGADCDDEDALRFPGAAEVCDVEGVDEDCDPTTLGNRDIDTDGHIDARCCNGDRCGDDCDDLNPSRSPTSSEVCDGEDDDCDGSSDEDFECSRESTRACTTTCGSDGFEACVACEWAGRCMGDEVCNGCDDDLDGDVEESFVCAIGDTAVSCVTPCIVAGAPGAGTGECSPDCSGGSAESCRAIEVCNYCDDDGDGVIDNGTSGVTLVSEFGRARSGFVNVLGATRFSGGGVRLSDEPELPGIVWTRRPEILPPEFEVSFALQCGALGDNWSFGLVLLESGDIGLRETHDAGAALPFSPDRRGLALTFRPDPLSSADVMLRADPVGTAGPDGTFAEEHLRIPQAFCQSASTIYALHGRISGAALHLELYQDGVSVVRFWVPTRVPAGDVGADYLEPGRPVLVGFGASSGVSAGDTLRVMNFGSDNSLVRFERFGVCDLPTSGIRLVGRRDGDSVVGRLLVTRPGQTIFGTVACPGLRDVDANAACLELGYRRGTLECGLEGRAGVGPIWSRRSGAASADSFTNGSDFEDLSGDGAHDDDAFVRCFP